MKPASKRAARMPTEVGFGGRVDIPLDENGQKRDVEPAKGRTAQKPVWSWLLILAVIACFAIGLVFQFWKVVADSKN